MTDEEKRAAYLLLSRDTALSMEGQRLVVEARRESVRFNNWLYDRVPRSEVRIAMVVAFALGVTSGVALMALLRP